MFNKPQILKPWNSCNIIAKKKKLYFLWKNNKENNFCIILIINQFYSIKLWHVLEFLYEYFIWLWHVVFHTQFKRINDLFLMPRTASVFNASKRSFSRKKVIRITSVLNSDVTLVGCDFDVIIVRSIKPSL